MTRTEIRFRHLRAVLPDRYLVRWMGVYAMSWPTRLMVLGIQISLMPHDRWAAGIFAVGAAHGLATDILEKKR